MTRLRLDSAARAELLHEIRYYEATRRGTGRRFREAVAAVFDRIKTSPEAGKPDEEGCRRMRVAGFPFSAEPLAKGSLPGWLSGCGETKAWGADGHFWQDEGV